MADYSYAKEHIRLFGEIPAQEYCPYQSQCELSKTCRRPSMLHTRFSCAAARGFNLVYDDGRRASLEKTT